MENTVKILCQIFYTKDIVFFLILLTIFYNIHADIGECVSKD